MISYPVRRSHLPAQKVSRASWHVAFWLLAALFVAGAPTVVRADQSPEDGGDEQAARIDMLISQLGHDSYATREKAQAELARMGLAAFDALLAARDADDVEVALRARYLVRGMKVGWVREDDPPEVKAILRGYEAAGLEHRRSILDRLAMEEGFRGTEALCRLAKFETNEMLSKKAAMLVMEEELPREGEVRQDYLNRVRQSVRFSQRVAAQWLRTYVDAMEGKEGALAEFDKLTRDEEELFALSPDQSSQEILGNLLMWQAGLLRERGRQQEAFDVIVRRLDLLDDGRVQVMATIDWLIHRQAWSLVDEVSKRFAARFDDDGEFIYRLAEARMKQGRVELAETLAKRAFELKDDDGAAHVRIGMVLVERGMFQWAEREYRHAMEVGPPGTNAHVQAHRFLAEMLHDQLDEMAAATVLQEMIDLAEEDETVKQQITRREGSLDPVISRMEFFYAEHFRLNDEPKKQIEHLTKAIEADPTDADVLIALYRAPTDEELRKKTRMLIRSAAAQFQKQIELFSQQVEQANDEEFRQWVGVRLAILYNQYAWLVGNTEGDYDTALRYSHRSLELRPGNAGYLDTLGRCYYAKGDYAGAVKYQSQAAERDAHSGAIQRQLELFQRALAKEHEAEEG
mgnify:CR=1 FL=1